VSSPQSALSIYLTFRMNRQDVPVRSVYALGDGRWGIPELRFLLENIAPQHAVMEAYEVEQDFSGIGRRAMLLNGRKVFYKGNFHTTTLHSGVGTWRRLLGECLHPSGGPRPCGAGAAATLLGPTAVCRGALSAGRGAGMI
jgi:hypothetical protein